MKSSSSLGLARNYRDFLRASYMKAREGKSSISIESYAQRLGLGASTFKMVITGARDLTSSAIIKVSRGLRLSPAESDVFESLVMRDQAKDSIERAFYARRLSRFRKTLPLPSMRVANRAFLSDPLVPALLVYINETEMDVALLEDSSEIAHLARVFEQKPEKIRSLLRLMKENGLILSSEGQVHYVFDKLQNVILQKDFLRRCLKDAEQRIDHDYNDEHSLFTATTFSVSDDEALIRFQADLKSLMDRYLASGNAAAPSGRMAQACFQVYPISKNSADPS